MDELENYLTFLFILHKVCPLCLSVTFRTDYKALLIALSVHVHTSQVLLCSHISVPSRGDFCLPLFKHVLCKLLSLKTSLRGTFPYLRSTFWSVPCDLWELQPAHISCTWLTSQSTCLCYCSVI